MKYAEIIVQIKAKEVDRIFFYTVPEDLEDKIKTGSRVTVPFGRGNRPTEGYVTALVDEVETDRTLKEITSIKDPYPVFSELQISLAKWMQKKYYCTLTDCLQCILPKITKDKVERYVSLKTDNEETEKIIKKNNRQSQLLKELRQNSPLSLKYIKESLEISLQTVKSLEKKGIVEISELEQSRDLYDTKNPSPSRSHSPTPDQQAVIDRVVSSLNDPEKKPFLLKGVTGSGKTLVYTEIIDKTISMGKQAVVLVPEISLTPQTVSRFIERFGEKVTVTHSKMTEGERFDQWKKAKRGDVSIMIGPRSAIFAPFENLGVIIIDEEHEKTYKSEITPKYDAREVALKLSELTGAAVLFGSATPSIESFYKTETGEYELLELNSRINMTPPDIFAVDMRDELALGNRSMFSLRLQKAIRETLKAKKQIILFLNRRGHSTFLSCRSCGYVMTCENCSVSYTYHKQDEKLVCHYCGREASVPTQCPACGSPYIKYFGAGTEKVIAEVNKLFPEARILRMDADTTKTKDSHRQILEAFAAGKADILAGTQMIAKGLDFPNVTLVGVIAADLSLNSSDFRSAENTFQLITQVAGRAGRAGDKGRVLIQTYMPENYCIEYAKREDYLSFYDEEIEFRRQMAYPPFSNIAVVLFTGEDEREVIRNLHILAEIFAFYGKNKDYSRIGPSAAAVSKIKNKFRHRLIIKGRDEEKLKNYIFYCLNKFNEKYNPKGITVSVTVNPTYIP
ncbi:MAG: primosomal protein N' [Clostridiales bacterium]|nr:primosomal protein N' [Clostridiales bacterium]